MRPIARDRSRKSIPSNMSAGSANRRPFRLAAPRKIGGTLPPSKGREARDRSILDRLRASGPTVSNRAAQRHSALQRLTPSGCCFQAHQIVPGRQGCVPTRQYPIRSPQAASPHATEAAAPEDEPPGTASSSSIQGGAGRSMGFSPRPEKASSLICVLPMTHRSHGGGVATTNTWASASGTRPFSRAVPASVADACRVKQVFPARLAHRPARIPCAAPSAGSFALRPWLRPGRGHG